MIYCKADGFDPAGEALSFDGAPVEAAGSKTARILRARAARYRELAAGLYDENLAGEVESLARELEKAAAKLEIGNYPFFHTALNSHG